MLRIEEIVGAMDDEFRYALDALTDERLLALKENPPHLRRLRPVGVSQREALAMIQAILDARARTALRHARQTRRRTMLGSRRSRRARMPALPTPPASSPPAPAIVPPAVIPPTAPSPAMAEEAPPAPLPGTDRIETGNEAETVGPEAPRATPVRNGPLLRLLSLWRGPTAPSGTENGESRTENGETNSDQP
jgi:hypothetical protein